MRLYLSTKGSRRPHLVLECSPKEARNIHDTMVERVGRPVQHSRQNGSVRYRFPESKLTKLVNTFPQAQQSPGIVRRIHSEEDIQVPPDFEVPGYSGELSEQQLEGVWAASQRRKFLLWDDMRLGKTRQALCVAAVNDRWPVLVITPNNVKHVWRQHIKDDFPELSWVEVGGSPAKRAAALEARPNIVIAHYEAIRIHTKWERRGQHMVATGDFVDRDWEMIILDEAHRLRGHASQQTLAIHALRAPRKVVLSATPVLNGRLEELWGPLHFAWPTKFPSYWKFTRDYCVVKRGQVVGYKNVQPLRDFIASRSIRRLNPAQLEYKVVEVELTKEQRSLYEEIKDELLLWMEDGTPKRIPSILVRATRLKQAAFSPELYGGSPVSAKIEEVRRLIPKLVAEGNKVIVFSQWSTATDILRRELTPLVEGMAYVTGDVPYTRREAEIERFQNDPSCGVYLGTIRSNQEGIALHAASHVVFTDLEWVPAINEQAAARALTWTPKEKNVRVVEIRAKDTIEERIVSVLEHKRRMNASFIERGGGARRIRRQIARDIRDLL